jgi:prepilin-type N-terminal cleavage/methylation domain-containing protein/prepilin-type processing-associated H-X9-DG protein
MNHLKTAHRRRQRRGLTLIELMVVISILSILAALLLPALARAREMARRTFCNNNMKQIGLVMRMYADEADGKFPAGSRNGFYGAFRRMEWLGRQTTRNNFGVDVHKLYPDYLDELEVFVCPSSARVLDDLLADWYTDLTLVEGYVDPLMADPRNANILPSMLHERPDPDCMTSQHYIFLPHTVATEENMLFLFDEYYRLMAEGVTHRFLDLDLEVPGGHGPGHSDTFYRIRDGVNRLFIEDINRPALTAVPETRIPLLFDSMSLQRRHMPNHVVPPGGNVLYMDGHVEYKRFPDKRLDPPYTPDLVEWLRANTYNNKGLQNVPPWCSNRLPRTEFAPRYLFYPNDPLYEDLYFTY